MSIGEMLENIAGPIDIIGQGLGIIRGILYGDMGYEFRIKRIDKGGQTSFTECKKILKDYGVATFWYGWSGSEITFRVKKRQARWGEHVLLAAGVKLLNPAYDRRNAGYIAKKAPGWMPNPWAKK